MKTQTMADMATSNRGAAPSDLDSNLSSLCLIMVIIPYSCTCLILIKIVLFSLSFEDTVPVTESGFSGKHYLSAFFS